MMMRINFCWFSDHVLVSSRAFFAKQSISCFKDCFGFKSRPRNDTRIRRILMGFAAAALLFCNYSCSCPLTQSKVCFNKTCFKVEVAQKQDELSKGLSGRSSLGEERGMLFIFSRLGFHAFWMKDTLIPLDIIWLDENRKVVYIVSEAVPCKTNSCGTYFPDKKARYVLEINAGEAAKNNIKVGDTAQFRL